MNEIIRYDLGKHRSSDQEIKESPHDAILLHVMD